MRVGVQDAAVMFGISEGSLYRLFGQPVVSFRGSLELSSRGSLVVGTNDWLSEYDSCGTTMGVLQMDMSLDQSLVWVARDASCLEGETTTTKEVMRLEADLGGGVIRRTSLIKRES